jgi:hypothetical protein
MKTRFGTLLILSALFFLSCKSAGPSAPPSGPATPGTGAPTNPNPAPAPPPPPDVTPAPPPPPQPTAPPQAAPPPPPPAMAVPAQPPAPVSARGPALDIIKLKQAGLSDEFLLNKIRTENTNYQLTTSDILDLRTAGISETVIEAMMRSGQPATVTAGSPVARRAEFSGLARVGKGFLVFGTSTSKNVGRLVVDGDKISWYEADDPKRNFSLYAKNLKEIFNTCVLRPEQNLCLEFGVVTYTGEEYRFRDPGWKKGDNRLVLDATNYFRQAFPYLFFTQRAVSEL